MYHAGRLEVPVVNNLIEFYGIENSQIQSILIKNLSETIKNRNFDVSISFNHDHGQEFPSNRFNVLILWEPASVMPWQYKLENYSRFNLVIPMSKWRAEKLGIQQYAFHPYDADPSKIASPFSVRSGKIIMINAAKFSAGKSSLYGLRRETSKILHREFQGYDLFGADWDMNKSTEIRKRIAALRNSINAREGISVREFTSLLWYRYPEHRGFVKDKFEILSEYQLSLVIENDIDWITEKVFDSIFAGCIPVYVGPVLIREFRKLENCLIRCEPDARSIINRLKNLSDSELLEKKYAIFDFIQNYDFSEKGFWSSNHQWTRISNIIRANLERLDYLNS